MKLTETAIKSIESIAIDSSLDAESKLRKIAVHIDFCSGDMSNGLSDGLGKVICDHFEEGMAKGKAIAIEVYQK